MEKPDLPVLTGLRLVAALSVVMAHSSVIVLFTDARWIPIIGFGLAYFGMSLFFVLSGFVIYLNYAPQFARLPIGEAALRCGTLRQALSALCVLHAYQPSDYLMVAHTGYVARSLLVRADVAV